MKDLCPDERPREKMRMRGAAALSNAELLAILLGSGTGGKNVMEVAQELISGCGGMLNMLGSLPLERLIKQKGVGEVRGTVIGAAFELGRRAAEEKAQPSKRALTSPEMVYQLMVPHMKALDHEECWALFLNRNNYLIGKEKITSGSMESTLIDIKGILRRAIEKQCRYVILVHNHPSGMPRPSQNDIVQTEMLKNALSAVEIHLSDHIIIADDHFYSFSEERVGIR